MNIIIFLLAGIGLLLLLVGILILIVYGVKAIYRYSLTYEEEKTVATVKAKEYSDEYTLGEVYYGARHPLESYYASYDVCLTYRGKEYWFDSYELYTNFEIGDEVPILVKNAYNRKGKLKNTYISF